jgi:hypothetical protein
MLNGGGGAGQQLGGSFSPSHVWIHEEAVEKFPLTCYKGSDGERAASPQYGSIITSGAAALRALAPLCEVGSERQAASDPRPLLVRSRTK